MILKQKNVLYEVLKHFNGSEASIKAYFCSIAFLNSGGTSTGELVCFTIFLEKKRGFEMFI
jgi:hypothetical protein